MTPLVLIKTSPDRCTISKPPSGRTMILMLELNPRLLALNSLVENVSGP